MTPSHRVDHRYACVLERSRAPTRELAARALLYPKRLAA